MSELLYSNMDYKINIDASFTKVGREYITRVVDLFKDMHFTGDATERVEGDKLLGERWNGFEFWLYPRKNNRFAVQFAKVGYGDKYMFGIEFDNSNREAFTYHHPYGPFTAIYGVTYECD
jgi:hypothetical protein